MNLNRLIYLFNMNNLILIRNIVRTIRSIESVSDINYAANHCDFLIRRHLINKIKTRNKYGPGMTLFELKSVNINVEAPGPIKFNPLDNAHLLYLGAKKRENILLNVLRQFSSKDTTLIDIGSNIGFYSFYYLNLGAENSAYAFEPNPILVQILKHNIGNLNSKIFEVAVSNKSGYDDLCFEMNSSGRGSIERSFSNRVHVKTEKLDDLLNPNDLSYSRYIIKIDTEGHDLAVVEGMQKWLENPKPKLFYIEARPKTIDPIYEIFAKYRYTMLDDKLNICSNASLNNILSKARENKYTNILLCNQIQEFVT